MDKKKSRRMILVCLDDDLALWLEGKALEGYKKASLIRSILHREMELEAGAAEFAYRNGEEARGENGDEEEERDDYNLSEGDEDDE